ncbi:MAG: N-6 DNA methylase [Cyanothece sp. SIO2G6]|nr:N-6 DNA methylase [Cyanothece sp. SIO2G6]
MPVLNLKPSHKPIRSYYAALDEYAQLGVTHETAVQTAFQDLLTACGRQFEWTLVPQYPIKRPKQQPLRVDGALVDQFNLARAFWEAKDSQDNLKKEVQKKFKVGYPKDNIIFQQPDRAMLYQDGKLVMDADLTDKQQLVDVVRVFLEYRPPAIDQWEKAAEEFGDRVKDHATALLELIHKEAKTNKRFIDAFADFVQLCRQAINPNLSEPAVEEMLIQHLLTERIFRSVFNNPDFAQRNIIAVEIEKVINALTAKSFSRTHFLSSLDRFYRAIEETAATIDDFAQKQDFLNTVYEKFFQGFSVKVADTHGIVYTPQPIVNFMVKSVEDILQQEFGKSLVDEGVHILDPFVGTGNFIIRVMREITEIQKSALPHKYKHELHCNEVMLLPYYIASMNIEHEYFEQTGNYQAFEGICLVDTFEDQRIEQLGLFTPENMKRVERQRQSDIYVVIGNPPYNVGQLNENDNNKNRRYRNKNKTGIDDRVSATYTKASTATNKNALSDPYVKAIRWASDRIGQEGIVAFVTNNSFLDQIAFDGMRQYLEQDFDQIYVFDLGGNIRKNPKLSGTTHNVFGIQVGVSVNIFVRKMEE